MNKALFRKLIVAVSAVLGAAVLASCDAEEPATQPLTPVRVQPVETRALQPSLRYTATIEPQRSVNLAFQVSGYITSILQRTGADGKQRDVQTGDLAKNGTVLAQVDPQPYEDKVKGAKSQLAEARAALTKGQNDFRRATALFKTQSMTAPEYDTYKKEFQTAEAAVAGAKSQLDAAKLDLQYASLKAPFDGVILQRNIEVGALVGPGTVGFVIADVTSVKAVFAVPSVVLGDVKKGNPKAITTQSLEGRTFEGTITSIAASADSSTRVFQVEVTVPNPDDLLKPGMVASLQVARAGGTAPSIVVPMAAIVRAPGKADGYSVFVVDGTGDEPTVRLQDIEVGQILGNSVAVTGGLSAGTRVVVYGATLVNDGEKVRVIP